MKDVGKGFWVGFAMLVIGIVVNIVLQVHFGYDQYTVSILGVPLSSLTETYDFGVALLVWVGIGLFILVHHAKRFGATAMFFAIVSLITIPYITVPLFL
ncbi:hypothetical protein JMA_39460 (plasmid) [Jeotgalibacillus malaysiensis]|uniref:Uncharacterized protein n=1 Tax=Jeotgalibacillus malaysiensis TaxID=1508404 RepID=A0A0B5AZ86_9BACL|nr:hypothetical protein [Jeotgalibacillus malaysiensis]AJD93264.1 hypothetical protein JMA_39460 [Jeotgalibacillus malaysiensis]